MNSSRRSSRRVLEVEAGWEGTVSHSASAPRKGSQQQPTHRTPSHQKSDNHGPGQGQVCLLLAALPQDCARVGIDSSRGILMPLTREASSRVTYHMVF